jgi:hypothetical protein
MTARAISYQLWIALRRPLDIEVGRLGVCRFPAGVYVYTGSAKRNLEARIARHCRKDKTLRWHIDPAGLRRTPLRCRTSASCVAPRTPPSWWRAPSAGLCGAGDHRRVQLSPAACAPTSRRAIAACD